MAIHGGSLWYGYGAQCSLYILLKVVDGYYCLQLL